MLIPPWTNQPLHLFHGTTRTYAEDIVANGVDFSKGRPQSDFGQGFYTTTQPWQAAEFAERVAIRFRVRPAVVQLELSRDVIATLDPLCFVLGTPTSRDFWSFVRFCRSDLSPPHHYRSIKGQKYDMVYGPVAESWKRLTLKVGFDQISFHTPRALTLLNNHAEKSIL